MRKWIYYCGSWASLIGCLLVASGLESYTGWGHGRVLCGGAGAAGAGCGAGGPGATAPSRKRTKSPARSGSRRKNERLTAERRAEGWADTA